MKNMAIKEYHLVELYFGKWNNMYFPVVYAENAISKKELGVEVRRAYSRLVKKQSDIDNFVLGVGVFNEMIQNPGFRMATRELFVIVFDPERILSNFLPAFNDAHIVFDPERISNNFLPAYNNVNMPQQTKIDALQIIIINTQYFLDTHCSYFKPNKPDKEFQNICNSFISDKSYNSVEDLDKFHNELEQLLIENGFELIPHIEYPIFKKQPAKRIKKPNDNQSSEGPEVNIDDFF